MAEQSAQGQEFIAVDPNSARPGFVLVQHRDLKIPFPGTVRCVIRAGHWSEGAFLTERRTNGEVVLMTSDDAATAQRYPEPIITLADCKAGDEVLCCGFTGEPHLWTQMRIVAVGEPMPNQPSSAAIKEVKT